MANRVGPQHLEIADRGCEGAGRHRAIDDDLAVGRDIAPGGERLDEQKRRQREEDDQAGDPGGHQLAQACHRAACFPPLDDDQGERNRQEHAVVVRRESDATGRARDQRVTLAGAVRTCTRPHARHRQVGDDDCQGRRHIVLDVMRVPHVQRGHGEEDRGRDRGAVIGEARRQPVERGNRGCAGEQRRARGRPYRCRSGR